MTRTEDQILADLDKHAFEFNFPVLDNAYVQFAAARLSGFSGNGNWLIAFEVLGFSTQEIAFVDDLYAFGSCIEQEGFISERIVLTSAATEPLFDKATNECLVDWSHWAINLRGQVQPFRPTRDDYAEAGIAIDRGPGPGTLTEIELLRFLVHKLGTDQLFLTDSELLQHFQKCRNLTKLIQTTNWQHPDIAGEEKPSENVSIRSLLESLLKEDPKVFDPGRPNTRWEHWTEME